MKEGWEYKKLGEVATFTRGLTYSKNDEADISDNIVLRSNNVDLSTGKLNFDELKYLKPEFLIPEEKKVKKGSLLMCMSNGSKIHLGKVALINNDYPYAFGGFMALVTPNEELNPQFFNYSLSSPEYKDFIKKLSEGANINNIKVKELELFTIPVPSLSEQQSIVDYLDSSFAKIDELKANAEKQLSEARALFQKALTKAMEPKEGWEIKKLSEITEVKDGTHDSPKYVTEGIPFVTQKNITINGFDLLNTKKITLEDHNKFYARSNVEFGDIIISMIGANRGMSCIVDTREIFSIKNVGLIKNNKNVNIRYLLFYLHSPAANAYVLDNSNGGAQEFIGLKGLRNFPIQLPSLAVQQRIVERLDSISENVRKYEEIQRKIIAECDALKQALLRQVFE